MIALRRSTTVCATTDRDEFEEAVADSLADSDYTDEEFDALVKKTVAEYDPYWKPCIILNVDN